jgi:hypothetical protein
MERLSSSLILKIARPRGLVPVILSAADQDFSDPWEFVIVDSACEERREVTAELWKRLRPDVPLVHVPPLFPKPPRTQRHSWDIPLFMNTGWVWARGEVCVHIEDYMVFRPNWLRTHTEFIMAHPNLVSLGHVMREPVFDDSALPHHMRLRPEKLRESMSSGLRDLYNTPLKRECMNRENYGIWLSGNMGIQTKHILAAGGWPEVPTHYPETFAIQGFFDYGLSMWPLEGADAWHIEHPGEQIIGNVLRLDANSCVYEPVEQQYFNDLEMPSFDLKPYIRDIKEERQKRGLWV